MFTQQKQRNSRTLPLFFLNYLFVPHFLFSYLSLRFHPSNWLSPSMNFSIVFCFNCLKFDRNFVIRADFFFFFGWRLGVRFVEWRSRNWMTWSLIIGTTAFTGSRLWRSTRRELWSELGLGSCFTRPFCIMCFGTRSKPSSDGGTKLTRFCFVLFSFIYILNIVKIWICVLMGMPFFLATELTLFPVWENSLTLIAYWVDCVLFGCWESWYQNISQSFQIELLRGENCLGTQIRKNPDVKDWFFAIVICSVCYQLRIPFTLVVEKSP